MYYIEYGYQDGSWEKGEERKYHNTALATACHNSRKPISHGGMARVRDENGRIIAVYSNGQRLSLTA